MSMEKGLPWDWDSLDEDGDSITFKECVANRAFCGFSRGEEFKSIHLDFVAMTLTAKTRGGEWEGRFALDLPKGLECIDTYDPEPDEGPDWCEDCEASPCECAQEEGGDE